MADCLRRWIWFSAIRSDRKDGLHPVSETGCSALAAFQNPEFYKARAMRLSTYAKLRVIACAEITHITSACREDASTRFTDCCAT